MKCTTFFIQCYSVASISLSSTSQHLGKQWDPFQFDAVICDSATPAVEESLSDVSSLLLTLKACFSLGLELWMISHSYLQIIRLISLSKLVDNCLPALTVQWE